LLVGNVHLTSGPNRHANIAGVWGPERLHGERHPLASHVGETSVAFDETSSIWNALVMKVATRLTGIDCRFDVRVRGRLDEQPPGWAVPELAGEILDEVRRPADVSVRSLGRARHARKDQKVIRSRRFPKFSVGFVVVRCDVVRCDVVRVVGRHSE